MFLQGKMMNFQKNQIKPHLKNMKMEILKKKNKKNIAVNYLIFLKVGLLHLLMYPVCMHSNKYLKHIERNPRFDRKGHWAEIGNIGQTYGTLGRY